MTNQSTLDKLLEMRLPAMAEAFRIQMSDPRMREVLFEDRFGMLVDVEYNSCRSNGLKRLIRNAGFDQPEAYIGDVNYTSGRKLNRELIQRLASCEYITEHRNLLLPAPREADKPISLAHWEWKPASNATALCMSGCRISFWTLNYPAVMALTRKPWPSMPTLYCSFWMNGCY